MSQNENQIQPSPAEELQAAINRAKADVPSLVSSFANNNIMPLFATIALWMAKAFNSYERQVSTEIQQFTGIVEADMVNLGERLQGEYDDTHNQAVKTLKDELRAAEIEKRRPAPLVHLETAILPEVPQDSVSIESQAVQPPVALVEEAISPTDPRYDYWKQVVAMAGHTFANISLPSADIRIKILEGLVVALVVFAVMALDYMLGYDIWDWAFNRNMATVLNIFTVAGGTLLARVMVVSARQISSHRDAVKRFKEKYPNGHPSGFTVDPLPAEVWHMFWAAFVLLFGGLSALTLARAVVAKDWSGLAVGIVLVFAFLIYMVAEYKFLSRPYSNDQYKALREAKPRYDQHTASLKQVQDQQAQVRLVAETNVMQQEVVEPEEEQQQTPIERYNQTMDTADQALAQGVEDAKSYQTDLIDMLLDYNEQLDETTAAFLEACNDLLGRVAFKFQEVGESSAFHFGEKEEDDKVMQLFTSRLHRKFDKPEDLERYQRFIFRFTSTDRRIKDFSKIEAEVQKSLAVGKIGGGEIKAGAVGQKEAK